MRKRGLRFWAVAAAIPFVLGACGGGDDGGAGGGGEVAQTTVAASEYADRVCIALKTWLSAIQKRASDLATAVAPGASPGQGQDALRDYLDKIISDTEEFIDSVKGVGTPDVDNGGEAANTLVAAFERIKSALEDARDQIGGLPTDSPQAFAAAAAQLAQTIQGNLSDAGSTLSDVRAPDLEAAFNDAPACQSATG